ncbi:MAG: AAA family ATPase, partial [Phycisphaeraceae bacterium]|nr:AAA family ATPase [Phycisphaeraceae bacterium]
MPQDQATQLRQMMAEARGVESPSDQTGPASEPAVASMPGDRATTASTPATRVVAVTSGKGGVGKTNVAVNLAAWLATQKKRVVLIDADLGLANADVLCNLDARVNLSHVVSGRRTPAEAMIEAPGGFRLVPGASGLAHMAAMEPDQQRRLIELFARIEADADLLIIDTGAGIGPSVLGFLLAADDLLVVTTPEPTAMADAYGLIKSVARQRPDAPIGLLVNMAES